MRSKNVTHLKPFHQLYNCVDENGSLKQGKEKEFNKIKTTISNSGLVLEEIICHLIDVGMEESVADFIGNKYFYL